MSTPRPTRQMVPIVLAAALVSVLFAVVSTSGGVDLWGPPQWDPTPLDRELIQIDAPADTGPQAAPDESRSDPMELPAWLSALIRVVGITIAFVVAVALAVYAWRRRPRLRWRRRAADADFEVLPDVASAVVRQAQAQRAALLDGAPRNAIVQCWLRLERDVAAAGLDRDPADTPSEFTERVLGTYAVDSAAITELAALYREARFSDHVLDESHRTAAAAALDRLHATLAPVADPGTPAVGAVPGPAAAQDEAMR